MSARHNRCHDWLAATPQKRWSSSGSIHFRVPFVRGSRKGEGITDLAHHINMIQYPHFFPSFPFVNYLPIYTIGPEQIYQKTGSLRSLIQKKCGSFCGSTPLIHPYTVPNSRRPRSCRLKSRPWSKSPEAQWWRVDFGLLLVTCFYHAKSIQEIPRTWPIHALMMYVILSIFVWAIPRNIQ